MSVERTPEGLGAQRRRKSRVAGKQRGLAAPATTPEGARSVTSVDVAREAGVSQATVARTFSSPEKVSDKTRERVHKAADRIGYVPNAIASSLKSQRTNIVGAVVPAHGEYWQSVLTAFSQTLAEASKQLLVFSFGQPEDVTDVLRSVQQYRLDGLILASATVGQSELAFMANSAIPTVTFNQPAAAGVLSSVTVDNESGMALIADHLADVGCNTVLYVGGIASTSTDRLRYQGAARALGHRQIACPYIEAGAFSYAAGHDLGIDIANRPSLPDAVMVTSDELAFGVMDGLRQEGVSIPGDVMVTGFDGLPQASWTSYDLTTLVQPTFTLVNTTVDLLLANSSESPAGKPPSIVIDGTLRVGGSTTQPKSKKA